ncbi:2-oxoacid:acceptor oxidoreductase subunit alpha [Deinococcus koreensis]|uniref:2-oxoacid:acceptor oxidoreductase subunit alpha n=1 Tax=Deinococcus koreensis TaxID=2054903 RepID=UPI001A9D14CA|nr:2-oxoacid:acceptor oxidoreductase subunit alpha [Deinococcus koreensis]
MINDFTIQVATVNGSGSQTANATLVDALFHMGLPVNAKNVFPSNIKGLPTWYSIRVSGEGFTARRDDPEILVAFNAKTLDEDLRALPPGGVMFYPDHLKPAAPRDDVSLYALPANAIMKEQEVDVKFRDRMANLVYVGALAQVLGIEMTAIHDYLTRNFAGKPKVVGANYDIAVAAFEWCAVNLTKTDPYTLRRMDATAGKILIDGNTAAALGAIYGGCTVVSWYPITPATSLAEGLIEWMPKLRQDSETGKATFAIVQAEDELAAIGMLVGAGWAGARAMTSTSGPGLSLMAEFAGYAYFAEVPLVIWNVQRMGPSTGLPTRVSQGDLLSTYYLSHGDTRHVILLPATPAECFEFGWRAFDIADELQTPVFVNSDLDLGMNAWMSEPFTYPEQPMKRGKVLSAEDIVALGGRFGRYQDEDGSGVGPRTLPGNDAMGAAYFTRGTGHTELATYSERPEDWQRNLARLDRKHEHARTVVPEPVVSGEGADTGIIAMGSTHPAIVEGRVMLEREGVDTDSLRVRALPFSPAVRAFIAAHERTVVVEMNQHGQLAILLRTEYPEFATRILSVAHCDGLPLTGAFVAARVKAALPSPTRPEEVNA